MALNIHPYQIVMILGMVISIIVLMVGWPRRKIIGGFFFIAFIFAVLEWLFSATVESFVLGQNAKILWSQIAYIGFVQTIPYLLMFVIAYVRQHNINHSMILTLMVIPFLTLVVAWTNSLHHWLWSGFSQGSIENNVLIYHHGFWFWVHTTYLYCLLLAGLVFLIKNIIKSPPAFRRQLMIVLLGIIFPVISGTVYTIASVTEPGMDITPTGFAVTGLFLVWGLWKFQLLDLLPVARAVLVEQLQDGVIVLDLQNRVVDINLATQKLLGWDPKLIMGQNGEQLIPELAPVLIAPKKQLRHEIPLEGSPGIILEAQSSILFNQSHHEIGKLLVIRDVTLRKRAEADLQNANTQLKDQLEKVKQLQIKLEQQALHDSLTGLYNRYIDEIIEKELSRCQRENKPLSLAMIDIDHFKKFNDQFGHQQGDLLLQAFSKYIKRTIRNEDFAARFGGDEILIAFPGMNQPDALKKAEEIRSNLEKLILHDGDLDVHTTVTIGIATYPMDGKKIHDIFHSADQALYAAKEAGRNQVKGTQPDLE